MKKIIAVILASIMLFSFAGCNVDTSGKLEEIKNKNSLEVYMSIDFPPFEYVGENNQPSGVDVEIGKAIADELGVEAKFKDTNFDSIIMSLSTGKGDIGISGITITKERQKKLDFSIPYIKSTQYLILPEDSKIEVFEDLEGKTVGYANGYTGQMKLEEEINDKKGIFYKKDIEIKGYATAMEGTRDIKNKRIDAMIMDEHVAKNVVNKNDGVKAVILKYREGSIAEEEYGVAIPKDNDDLLELINKVITELKDKNKIDDWAKDFAEDFKSKE